MSSEPEKREDKRTRVDRILDRFKNNRVAAVFIVAAIVLAGVAGVTDSLRKLADAMPGLSSAPDLNGEWRSTPAAFYPVGPEIMVLRLKEAVDGHLLGQVEFVTPAGQPRSDRFDLLEGRRNGGKLSMAFSSGAILYTPGQPGQILKESISGELQGGELRLIYVREGHAGVPVSATRVRDAAARN